MKNKITRRIAGVLLLGASVFWSSVNAAPGDLDPTFDGDGKLTTSVSGIACFASAVAVQADGKIVAAGQSGINTAGNFALVRYNQNGSLDTTFDGDGIVTTDFSVSNNYLDTVTALVIQPDGKIIAAGYTDFPGPFGFALARYNPNGSLDTTFDSDGKVTTYLTTIGASQNFAYAVALQPDGKIVAAGAMYLNSSTQDFALVRYNPDGSLDTTFDGDGKVTTPIGNFNDVAQAIAIQTDGKIVAAGYLDQGGSYREYALVRYNADGSLDTSFDEDGKVQTVFTGFSDYANAVSIQLDGRIIAAGFGTTNTSPAFSMARYNPNGSLDTTFDNDGKVLTQVVNSGTNVAKAVVVQPDGRIIAGGYSGPSSGPDNFTLVRYNTNGSLDSSYGTDGSVRFGILGAERLTAMTLDSIGRAVAVGASSSGGNGVFAVARTIGDVAPNANVSVSGRVLRADERGIFNGFITLSDSAGNTRIARTNPFGYYRFLNVPVGTASLSVSAKRFAFVNPTQIINLTENIGSVNFTAIE